MKLFKKKPRIRHHKTNFFLGILGATLGYGSTSECGGAEYDECLNMSQQEYWAYHRRVPIKQVRQELFDHDIAQKTLNQYKSIINSARHLRSAMRLTPKSNLEQEVKNNIKEYDILLKDLITKFRVSRDNLTIPAHPAAGPPCDSFARLDIPLGIPQWLPEDISQGMFLVNEVSAFVELHLKNQSE